MASRPGPALEPDRPDGRTAPQRRVLPTFYYLDHLAAVFRRARELHGRALRPVDRSLIDEFSMLPKMSRALWARMASRKGRYFARASLHYDEIDDVDLRIEELRARGFVRAVAPRDRTDWLVALTKAELLELGETTATPLRPSWPKARLVEALGRVETFDAWDPGPRWVVQRRSEPLRFIAFLFMGRLTDDLKALALRDFGLIAQSRLGGERTARFEGVEEATAAYFFERGIETFRRGDEHDIEGLSRRVDEWPSPPTRRAEDRRDALLYRLAGHAERRGELDAALDLYERSSSTEAAERIVRIRYGRGEVEWAKARLEEMIDRPTSDDECAFALDFYRRKFRGKRTSAATDLLRAGCVIELDEAFRHMPERAAARYFSDRGERALFGENRLFRALFGALFHELLFGPDAAGFHGEFELVPSSLRDRTFYEENEGSIEERLSLVEHGDREGTRSTIEHALERACETPNGLFRADWFDAEVLTTVLTRANARSLVPILRAMARDYRAHRTGYPDLALIDGNDLRFVEIKAEGDVLRREQMRRLEELRAAGFDASICRVEWRFDPARVYTVVDIETTGGRSDLHRVTEIAAVRVQHGEILERWTTLVDPERSIPPAITRLTGITNQMVHGAPRFEAIADELEAFLEGSIFVAHNVSFDHGFLAAEYRRLGRRFANPRLCTVASMRRYFPGSKSYSLGSLCREYGIELERHHRAMDDALATVELLRRVHDARLG